MEMRVVTIAIPVDIGRKLNVHKTFMKTPGRLLDVLCPFNLRPVSTGIIMKELKKRKTTLKKR